jgi:adenylate cyclase
MLGFLNKILIQYSLPTHFVYIVEQGTYSLLASSDPNTALAKCDLPFQTIQDCTGNVVASTPYSSGDDVLAQLFQGHPEFFDASSNLLVSTVTLNSSSYVVTKKLITRNMLNWILVYGIPENENMESINASTTTSLVIVFSVLVITLIITIIFTVCVTRPLFTIAKQMDQVTKLNFVSAESSCISSSTWEIAQLNDSFMQMNRGIQAFSKYLPREMVVELLQNNKHCELGMESRNMTVMFTDIENFTTMCDQHKPHVIISMLNRYFEEMCDIIQKYFGTIDKFIGDSIMAFWNAPIAIDRHEIRACLAAIEMAEKLIELNIEWKQSGLPPLNARIGIHVGEALVGNIGSNKRMIYMKLSKDLCCVML